MCVAVQFCMGQLIVSQPLYCVQFGGGPNDTLTWGQAPNNACGPFWGYKIYRSALPTGPFMLLSSVPAQNVTTYIDRGASTGDWYYYIVDSFSCPGATYQPSDTVENRNPKTPDLVSVSVDSIGHITVSWLPSASPQTRFYYVYIITPSGTPQLVTTVRAPTTYWVDTSRNASNGNIKYTVAATDSCYGNPPSAYNTHPQQTTFLKYQAARCDRAIKLNWTKYINMRDSLLGYRVYVSRNLGPYTLVAAVDSITLNYDYPDFADGDSLQVYVEAVSHGDTTLRPSSNYLRFVASVVKPPTFLYLTRLSVDTSNNAVDVTWIVDSIAKLENYQVSNSEDNNAYTIAGTINFSFLPVHRLAAFADSSVTPQYGIYYYEVKAVDSCQTSTLSAPGNIIALSATLSDYYQVTVNWNLYHLYGATVSRYNLYRKRDGGGPEYIRSFDSTVTTYIDSVFQYLNDPGEFCYFIKADYHLDLPVAHYSLDTNTFSNIACVDHRPIIYIPNAFVYNGSNNFFKPRIIFGDPTAYTMTIWDRYGGKIFETHDPQGSWDGTNHGQVVQQGGYAYLIQFTALDGTPVEKKGIVAFIKK